jgi:hypothetical protein
VSRNINRISASSYFTAEVEATVHKTNNSTSSVIKKSTNSGCPPAITMPDPKTTTNSGCPPAINMPDPLLVIEDNNTPQQELEPAQQTDQKAKRSIIIEDTTVQVKGKDHTIWGVPKTHVLVHRSYLKKLQNKASQIDELNQSVRKKKYTRTPLASVCSHLH